MADTNEKIVFSLDAETKDLLQKLNIAKEELKKLGSKDNTKGLVDSLMEAKGSIAEIGEAKGLSSFLGLVRGSLPIIAAMGTAVAAVKTGLDMTLESETIKGINTQFEILTRNANVSGDALKEGLVKASAGLIDDTELLKAANEQLVTFGSNAKRLPEIMELARKASVVSGKDMATTFNELSTAIATGNQRALKHNGIIIDTQKAYKDYAASIGTTAALLSEEGRQAALLNATLEKGKEAFRGIDDSTKPVTNSLQRIRVAFDQLRESVVTYFGPIFSKTFETIANNIVSSINETKTLFDVYVRGAKDSQTQTDLLKIQIQSLEGQIKSMSKLPPIGQQGIEQLRNELDRKQAELDLIEQKIYQRKATEAGKAAQEAPAQAAGGGLSQEDLSKATKQQAAFEEEITRMKLAHIEARKSMSQSVVDFEANLSEQKRLIEVQRDAQLDVLATNDLLKADQKAQMKVQIEQQAADRIAQIEENSINDRERMYDNMLRHSTGVMDGIAKAAFVSSQRAANSMKAGGDMGRKSYQMLEGTAVDAFAAIGEGAVTGQNLVKKAVLGGLGDMAIAHGKTMLLASLWPLNPAAAAGGAALIVLGGALKGAAGGGGGGAGGESVSAGPSSYDMGTLKEPELSDRPAMQEVKEKKSVTIAVQGNYFETEQTRTRLMEMIRESTDYTDFSYKQIGQ